MRAGMTQILRDTQFWQAVIAALLFWTVGYLWFTPQVDWAWPLHQPRDLLYLVLIYPLVEELLFRGVLQGYFLRRPALQQDIVGLTGANLLTSTIFTGLHFLMHPPLAAAAVMVPSLIFGHFRDRFGTLHAPIMLHIYYNLGYFWIFASQ